jgi:parallel beta-helix repeat protein
MNLLRAALATLLVVAATACSDDSPSTAPTQDNSVSSPDFALTGGTGSSAAYQSRLFPDMCVSVVVPYESAKLLETWSCHFGANQQFIWNYAGGPSGTIVPTSSRGLCWDAKGGGGRDGDPIQLWTCYGAVQQKWYATAAGEIRGINDKCIGLAAAVRANGTKLTLQTCNGSLSQKWDNAASSTPTTSDPVPPPTSPLPSGIAISPGQSIQSFVNANPIGTTFILKAGTHIQQSVVPKSGDRFFGEPGAVLDGQGVAQYAFSKGNAPYPSNVTISGLKITNYVPSTQHGAVEAGGFGTAEGTTGWVIDRNEISYNGEYGIKIGNSSQITNNNVHHNKRLNIAGSGNNTLIASNEIAFGHYLNTFNTNFEAGGTKFSYTDGLILRNNYVHDNTGVGFHMDENNINTIIDGNRIDHNGSEGIAIEISYKTTILNNTITNNGWFDPRNRYTYLWNAGIGVHSSPNVEVYGNKVSGNYAGVVAIDQDRSTDVAKYGAHVTSNLYVHNNTITQNTLPRTAGALSVGAGAATDIVGNTAMFTSRNNRFAANTYYLGTNPYPFAWQFGARTEAQWKAYGEDTGGVFYH